MFNKMSLIVKYPYNGREDRICHESDSMLMICQIETGNLYVEAVDVYPCKYTYEETDVPIVDVITDFR